MNIIKFLDNYKENDSTYNDHFRNKYCYVVNWQWIVVVGDISPADYIRCSQSNSMDVNVPVLDFELYKDQVDVEASTAANSITSYDAYNRYHEDDEITIDELKIFRRWLATSRLELGDIEDIKVIHMLRYYAQDMYDSTCKDLVDFSDPYIEYSPASSCGCHKTTTTPQITTSCNPLAIYRAGVRGYMVKYFSDIDFWKVNRALCADIVKYLRGIIKNDFIIDSPEYFVSVLNCGCVDTQSKQNAFKEVLGHVAEAFEYIATQNESGHLNFITDTLHVWASQLYEKMFWL